MVSSDLKKDNQLLVLKVKGDILSTNAKERAEEIGNLIVKHKEVSAVKLDINAAKMVDSVGLNMLLGIIKTVRENEAELVIHISSASINRVFLMSRFDKLAKIHFREKRTKQTRP